jgi:hypothetical protein
MGATGGRGVAIVLFVIAVLGTLVSGTTTLIGTRAIFPEAQLSAYAALGMAVVFQAGLLFGSVALSRLSSVLARVTLLPIVLGFGLFSSLTSFVCFYSGFTSEQFAEETQHGQWVAVKDYFDTIRRDTQDALDTVNQARAEATTRYDQEIAGTGLENIINPYLDRLIEESPPRFKVDPSIRVPGRGERAGYIENLLAILDADRRALESDLAGIDRELEVLVEQQDADAPELLAICNRGAQYVRADLLGSINGDYSAPELPEHVFVGITRKYRWVLAVEDLARLDRTALVLAFFAILNDVLIFVFGLVAGAHLGARKVPTLSLERLLRMSYGQGAALRAGIDRWLEARSGDEVSVNNEVVYPLDMGWMDVGDERCAALLSANGYLKHVEMPGHEVRGCLTARAMRELVDLANRVRPARAAGDVREVEV